jgi:phosphotriesterase-related protein
MIRTVTGDIDAWSGRVLAHEHLQIDLSDQKGPAAVLGPAEEDAVVDDLRTARLKHDLAIVVDLSVPDIGRNPLGLRRISERSGVAVVCASGFYWDPFPPLAAQGSTEELRDIMITEISNGVGDTGVRCGVVKVGTPNGKPTEAAERLFRAAALAATATGTCLITHTSSLDQIAWHMDVLERAGMDLRRVLISHLNAATDTRLLADMARRGVFFGIDKVSFLKGPTNAQLADLVRAACEDGLADHIILSSDIARKERLQRFGGAGYSTVFADFLPMLEERGVSPAQIETMLCRNPARLLSLQ